MDATTRFYESGVASSLSEPRMSFLDETVNSFVAMANLQPGSSVLDLGCGIARVAIAARNVLGGTQTRIVAIDKSDQMLMEAEQELRRTGLKDEITLLAGDITQMDSIQSLLSQSSHARPTFDVIFARNVLGHFPTGQHVALLQHWATYLTPVTGRMVLTQGVFAQHAGEKEGEIAGAVLVKRGDGRVMMRIGVMMEAEWALGEQRLSNLIATSGLQQVVVRRVAFDEKDGFTWLDHASWCEQMVSSYYVQALQRNRVDPAWTNDDGSFSHLFKAQAKFQILEDGTNAITNIHGHDDEFVAPYMAVLACVVMV